MQHTKTAAFLLVLAPFAPLAQVRAQTTWVVDEFNGPGTDFTDLPAAVAAATNGDTIRVRSGDYSTTLIDKAIRVLGETGATVSQSFGGPAMQISGIGAGQTLTIRDITFNGTSPLFGAAGVEATSCAGQLVFDSITIEAATPGGGLALTQCASVSVHDSLVRAMMTCTDSTVTASHSSFLAYDFGPISPGVQADNSTVELNQCVIAGSEGGGHAPAADGLRGWQSHFIVRGDANATIFGGTYIFGTFVAHAINGQGNTTLEIDPDVSLNSPAFNMASIVERDMALFSADFESGTLDVGLQSEPGDVFGIFIGLPGQRLAVPPFGAFWIHLPTLAPILSGSIDGTGQFSLSIPIPPAAGNAGLGVTLQALTNGSVFELTNAVGVILE